MEMQCMIYVIMVIYKVKKDYFYIFRMFFKIVK